MYLFIGNLLSEIINAVGAIYVASLLDVEQYGVLSLYYLVPFTFGIITNLGIKDALIRIFSKYSGYGKWEIIKKTMKKATIFQLVVAVVVTVFVVLFADPIASIMLRRPNLGSVVIYSAILIIIQSFQTLIVAMCTGLDRMDYVAFFSTLMSVVKTSVAIFLVLNGYGANGAFAGHIAGVGAAVIVTSILLIRYVYTREEGLTEITLVESEYSLGGMLRYGFPLYAGILFFSLGDRYLSILLANLSTDSQLGNLDVARKFLSLLTLFTVPISTIAFPAFSKFSFKDEKEKLESMFTLTLRYASLIVIPVIVVIVLFYGPGIYLIFNTKYADAPIYLQYAMLQFLVVGLGSLSNQALFNSQGETATTFRINAFETILKMGLCTVLTWYKGIPGFYIGILFSLIITKIGEYVLVKRRYNFSYDIGHSLNVLLFSLISGGIVYYFMGLVFIDNIFIRLVVGTLIYIASCMLLAPITGALNSQDIESIGNMLKVSLPLYPLITPFLKVEDKIIRFFAKLRD